MCSDYYVPMIAEEVFKQGRICIMHLEAIWIIKQAKQIVEHYLKREISVKNFTGAVISVALIVVSLKNHEVSNRYMVVLEVNSDVIAI